MCKEIGITEIFEDWFDRNTIYRINDIIQILYSNELFISDSTIRKALERGDLKGSQIGKNGIWISSGSNIIEYLTYRKKRNINQ